MFTKPDKSISILIPDGESHLLTNIMNCLSLTRQIKIYIISSKKWLPYKFSSLISGFTYYPTTDNNELWVSQIEQVYIKNKIDLLMPIFEIGIQRVIKSKHLFSPSVKIASIPDSASFDHVNNKWHLNNYCSKHQIPIPKGVKISDSSDINKNSLKKFPLIIKPIEGFGGGQGVELVTSLDSLKSKFLNSNSSILAQEFIDGYDIDCSILAREGKILAYTIQKGNLKGSGSFSPYFGIQFIENGELFDVVKKIVKSLNWNGVAHLDMRYDQLHKRYVLIEINPRYWATVDGSCLVGVNFPYLAIIEAFGESFKTPTYETKQYLNLKGLFKVLKSDFSTIFNWQFIYNQTQMRFVFSDIKPVIYRFFNRTINLLIR